MATATKAKPIGILTHYYDKIGVGIIKLSKPLKVGDTITVSKGEHTFTQTVDSLELDHESVTKAGEGKEVGLKLSEKIKEGALVELA